MLLYLAAGSVLALILLYLYVKINYKKGRTPRGFSEFTPVTVERKASEDVIKDSFKISKVPNEIDYIVIGSGMGGLYTAALLAKVGKKVLVLEQHYIAGGSTHEFEDKGYSFDSGVHYVGKVEKYGYLLDLVSDPNHKVEWAQMGDEKDGYVYDEVWFGTKHQHSFRAGTSADNSRERFIKDLVRQFPDEEEAIVKYVELCEKMNKKSGMHFEIKVLPGWFRKLMEKFVVPSQLKFFYEYAGKTAWEVITSLTDNIQLATTLCGQFGDYGLPPDEASFFIHAGIVCHYMGGAYYPVGGSALFARALIPTIEAAGGRVLVKADVGKILVENGQAVGVEMSKKKEQIIAKYGVISSAGVPNTYGRLLEGHVLKQFSIPPVHRDLGPSTGHVCAFVGLKGTTEELGIRNTNLWVLPTYDQKNNINDVLRQYYQAPFDTDELLMFASFPSAKDPSWQERYPGKSTCCIIAEARMDWFKDYKDERQGARGKDYEAMKNSFKERLLKRLVELFPKIDGKIDYCEMSSPLSTAYFLGGPHGESYGMACAPERFVGPHRHAINVETNIPGLWLTGQDVTTPGWAGAMMAGLVTAMRVLGYGTPLDVVTGRDLVRDLEHMLKTKQGINIKNL